MWFRSNLYFFSDKSSLPFLDDVDTRLNGFAGTGLGILDE